MRTLVLLAILAAMPVGAQVIYDYTGQPMTLSGEWSYEGGTSGCCVQNYTMWYSFLGDVVLSQALNPNQANQQVVPIAYAFNDPGTAPGAIGGLYYDAKIPAGSPLAPVGPNPVPWPNYNSSGVGIPTLDFSTANGKITSFSMTFGGSSSYGIHETLTLTSAGDSYNSSFEEPDCECGGYWNGSNSVGGSWVQVPEIDPNGVATALTLLAGGLLVVKGRRPCAPAISH
jgi:hypothetical protein